MKIQDSTIYPSPTLCIKPQEIFMAKSSSGIHWSSHGTNFILYRAFYGHWWQRGRSLDKDMKCFGQRDIREMRVQAWTWIKRGATLKNRGQSKFLDKRSTQLGGASSKIWNVWTKIYKGDESASMDMDQEGATLKNRGGSKFLDKRSTQVGGASSWTWLSAFDLCIFMCLLAFALVFKFFHICNACVMYASLRIWMMIWFLACIGCS